jgi:hypothetical protein
MNAVSPRTPMLQNRVFCRNRLVQEKCVFLHCSGLNHYFGFIYIFLLFVEYEDDKTVRWRKFS